MAHTATEDRPKYLGHHYDTVEQQFQSGKLGMWLFLATEILLFAGLFCAYAVYRRNHPEIFLYAHHFLDTKLGGLNTIVLIFSSLTMAIGVRCAQKGQRTMLITMLTITFLCACTFLGVKYVEYNHKWKHGLLWGTLYQEQGAHGADLAPGAALEHAPTGAETAHNPAAGEMGHSAPEVGDPATAAPGAPGAIADAQAALAAAKAAWAHLTGQPLEPASIPATADVSHTPATTEPAPPPAPAPAGGPVVIERSTIPHAAPAPTGLASPNAGAAAPAPSNVHIFFGIYFVMTGLHGLHVIIGMIVIAWLIVRSAKGHFGPDYFTPVDLGGLYWHIVDLIWIYLFPLLYLIH